MYTTPRRLKQNDESLPKKPVDDKIKRTLSNLSTPRAYLQKTSTTDIYGQKKTANPSTPKAPRKSGTTNNTSNVSPMVNQLKASSTTTVISERGSKEQRVGGDLKVAKKRTDVEVKTNKQKLSTKEAKVNKNVKELTRKEAISNDRSKKSIVSTNVTVNSPVVKKKIIQNDDYKKEKVERQRTKTRTLDESEAKILTPDAVDNNIEMQNLTRKLGAKPKAFYVDLNDDETKIKKEKVSEDEEYSYEDDFESYESDFESYHSDKSSNGETCIDDDGSDEAASNDVGSDEAASNDVKLDSDVVDINLKETKDEEKMLDSGSFDLREAQRSAQKTKPMEFIVEHSEDLADKKTSLTDEGFQDMSSSSAMSSMKTVHVDVLERPLLIDFSKSSKINLTKQNAQRRKQRAKDLLNMISLHTMSYSLFELNPIPYDVYMATYGRTNYKQAEIQTNEDGVIEEVQTEFIEEEEKWTQHPVKFSKNCIKSEKPIRNNETDLDKFSFLLATDEEKTPEVENDDYKTNPLRIYLEQKDGAGSSEILAYGKFKSKLENYEVNMRNLKRFIKRVESRIVTALSAHTIVNKEVEFYKKSGYPFSDNYLTLSLKGNSDFKDSKIVDIIFSDTKSNLAITVHKKPTIAVEKCVLSLWDISSNLEMPIRMLVSVDEVHIAKFHGGTDGIFVAALKDGSLHLWDLSERPTYTQTEGTDQLQDVKQPEPMSQVEIDREWNLRNSQVGCQPISKQMFHSSAFTSSGINIGGSNVTDIITGLEVMHEKLVVENGKKIIGQICSLLRIGILTVWSIVQEKKIIPYVIGKAYWSRTKLEKHAQINLSDFIDKPILEDKPTRKFSLNAAKRRLNKRKSETARLKCAAIFDSSNSDRPTSASRRRNCAGIENGNSWDSGIVCKDLKVMKVDGVDHYLIAKNGGEVLSLTRNMGVARVEKLCVATDMTTITKLDVSPHGLPYFLAATDSGTLALCSLLENRVLLALDCRNGPPSTPSLKEVEKYNTDSRGRFIGTVPVKQQSASSDSTVRTLECQTTLKSLHWLSTNPCSIVALSLDGVVSVWQLERSDICPSFTKLTQAVDSAHAQGTLAFVTQDGDVEVHSLTNRQNLAENLSLFQKYVSLL